MYVLKVIVPVFIVSPPVCVNLISLSLIEAVPVIEKCGMLRVSLGIWSTVDPSATAAITVMATINAEAMIVEMPLLFRLKRLNRIIVPSHLLAKPQRC